MERMECQKHSIIAHFLNAITNPGICDNKGEAFNESELEMFIAFVCCKTSHNILFN
jgi:hypothetical protein